MTPAVPASDSDQVESLAHLLCSTIERVAVSTPDIAGMAAHKQNHQELIDRATVLRELCWSIIMRASSVMETPDEREANLASEREHILAGYQRHLDTRQSAPVAHYPPPNGVAAWSPFDDEGPEPEGELGQYVEAVRGNLPALEV